ncbi:Palmitoyltransferase ZDHHC6 [Geodia barretti]|nr:Palmitoyltransferase ZDHHC6 [Geodia barretti]
MVSLPRVIHWGPLTALFIVISVSITGTYTALQLWSLPQVRAFRLPNFVCMYFWLVPILTNFFSAMNSGPGYVPMGWKPAKSEDEKSLQFCKVCRGFKPPRSHHCRQCGRCIKKMDHHCPWINHCVGHSNHAAFLKFLFFVPFGCLHGVILNVNFLYRFINYEFLYTRPYLKINTFWLIYVVGTVGLAIGTIIGVFILFLVQLKSILHNQTQIEDWIVDKAHRRRGKYDEPFVFPYDIGTRKNFAQVVNWSGRPKGDGIEWPVKEGSNKYSFTLEQLEQKMIKKSAAITCSMKHSYSGYSCPLSFGLMTSLCSPRCGEGFVSVKKGDKVTITRWQT